jgi:hypothetical protein
MVLSSGRALVAAPVWVLSYINRLFLVVQTCLIAFFFSSSPFQVSCVPYCVASCKFYYSVSSDWFSLFWDLICHLIVIIYCMPEALSRCELLKCRPAPHCCPKLPAHTYRVISDLGIAALSTHRGSRGGKSAKRARSLKKIVSLGLINARSVNKRAVQIHYFLHLTSISVLAITEPGLLSIMVQMTFGHSARMAILRCTFLAVAAKAGVLRSFIGIRFGLTLPHWT